MKKYATGSAPRSSGKQGSSINPLPPGNMENPLIPLIRSHLGGTATQGAAELALQAVTRAIRDGLKEDGEVKLARFGTFRLKSVAPRRLTLPGSGKAMELPRRRVLRFTPSPCLPSLGKGPHDGTNSHADTQRALQKQQQEGK